MCTVLQWSSSSKHSKFECLCSSYRQSILYSRKNLNVSEKNHLLLETSAHLLTPYGQCKVHVRLFYQLVYSCFDITLLKITKVKINLVFYIRNKLLKFESSILSHKTTL